MKVRRVRHKKWMSWVSKEDVMAWIWTKDLFWGCLERDLGDLHLSDCPFPQILMFPLNTSAVCASKKGSIEIHAHLLLSLFTTLPNVTCWWRLSSLPCVCSSQSPLVLVHHLLCIYLSLEKLVVVITSGCLYRSPFLFCCQMLQQHAVLPDSCQLPSSSYCSSRLVLTLLAYWPAWLVVSVVLCCPTPTQTV